MALFPLDKNSLAGSENHNFYDIALLTSFSRQKIAQIAKKYNLSESKNFLDPHRVSVIKACRYALNKPLEAGSITYEDLEAVKCKCHHLIFEDEERRVSIP